MSAVIPAGAASGQVLYGQIESAADARIANGTGLENYTQANWANYAITMPEQPGSGRYILTAPGYLPDGRYFVMTYIQLTVPGSPAPGDTPIDIIFFDFVGGNVVGPSSPVNVGQINGSAPAAVNLAISTKQFVTGVAAAGTLTKLKMSTNLTATTANIYAGRLLLFTSGINLGLAVLVTGYTITGGIITFVAFNNLPAPNIPAAGDTFLIS